MERLIGGLRSRLASSIGTQIQAGFGLTVALALLVALISLSATADATGRLESLQDAQRRMVSAIKDLELSAELQNGSVQAYLLSGDERYLAAQASGKERFDDALETLYELTLAEDGLTRLDEISRSGERLESSAMSQLALYRQGWERSAIYLWRTEGQESRQQLEGKIDSYRGWYESDVLADVAAARERGRLALIIAIILVVTAAGVGLVVGIRLSRSTTSRLGTLAAAAAAIGVENFSTRVAIPGMDEMAALGAAMNQMAAHLQESQRALAESQAKLQESHEKYRLLAETAMDVVYSLDLDGRYVYVNPAIEKVAGYRPEEILGRRFTEFLPEEIRQSRLESFQRRMQGDDEGSTADIEYLAKDGRRVPLDLRLTRIERDGKIVGMQGIARDVTARRAMEAEIRRLAEQEHRRAEQLQQVAVVGREISRLTDLDHLLPNVTELLSELFEHERVEIFLFDAERQVLTLRAHAGEYAAPVPESHSLRCDQGVVGWVATNSSLVRLGDVRNDSRYVCIESGADTLSELAVPLRSAGETLGVLNIESRELNRFDSSDEAAAVILARHIGTVIQNARLFEQQHNLAVAEERNRLAREIHDTLAQGLTAITLQLEVADALLDVGVEQTRPKILKALDLTRANLEEARRSVMDLRAAPLQERTLPAALEELTSGFGREHEVRADFVVRNVSGRLPAAMEAGLYRIAQEALNNTGKHSDATSVHLSLEQEDNTLVLVVQDDGAGFDPSVPRPNRRKGGFGLVGMQERAKLLGGQLEIKSAPNEGTQVVVRVPLTTAREAVGATAGAERA